jgi:hypothetical protein
MAKVIIAGCRDITDTEKLNYALNTTFNIFKNLEIGEVVCGEARGVDELGKQYAISKGIPVKSFYAKWELYGKSTGHKRNKQMAEYGDILIAIWDGRSSGTRNMIENMKNCNKPCIIFIDSKYEVIGDMNLIF